MVFRHDPAEMKVTTERRYRFFVQSRCDNCGKSIESDGFCANHGPHFNKWLCDACVELETDWWEQEVAEDRDDDVRHREDFWGKEQE